MSVKRKQMEQMKNAPQDSYPAIPGPNPEELAKYAEFSDFCVGLIQSNPDSYVSMDVDEITTEAAFHGLIDWVSNDLFLETADGRQMRVGFLEDITGAKRDPISSDVSVMNSGGYSDYTWRSSKDEISGKTHWSYDDSSELNSKQEEAREQIQKRIDEEQNMRGETVDPYSVDRMKPIIGAVVDLMLEHYDRKEFEVSMGLKNPHASIEEMDMALQILQSATPVRNPYLG